MTDPRYRTLADLLVGYSTQVKKGEKVLLDMIDVPDAFTVALAR
ncbi:MAG: aminopeptidase, partial [Pedosphaera sp.]|nr:aminopeptidase [Pedosphaera sp.]